MIRRADVLFAQTRHEIQVYKAYGAPEGKITLLPLPVDLAEFNPLPPQGKLKTKYGLSNRDKILLFLGRIHYLKGIHRLIPVMVDVRKQYANAKLFIVGRDDGYLNQLKELVDRYGIMSHVIFTGPMYQEHRFDAYVDADIFLYTPLNYEETSTAALEACACYAPPIVTPQASIPYLEEYHAGFCMDFDRGKFVDRILYLLTNQDERERYSRNARRLIEEKFSLREITMRIESEFQKIISLSRR